MAVRAKSVICCLSLVVENLHLFDIDNGATLFIGLGLFVEHLQSIEGRRIAEILPLVVHLRCLNALLAQQLLVRRFSRFNQSSKVPVLHAGHVLVVLFADFPKPFGLRPCLLQSGSLPLFPSFSSLLFSKTFFGRSFFQVVDLPRWLLLDLKLLSLLLIPKPHISKVFHLPLQSLHILLGVVKFLSFDLQLGLDIVLLFLEPFNLHGLLL
jgi:hypothetical protein